MIFNITLYLATCFNTALDMHFISKIDILSSTPRFGDFSFKKMFSGFYISRHFFVLYDYVFPKNCFLAADQHGRV